jgi:hypothetical protein
MALPSLPEREEDAWLICEEVSIVSTVPAPCDRTVQDTKKKRKKNNKGL